jgi:hypothetical protein
MICPFCKKEHKSNSSFCDFLPPVVLTNNQLNTVINLLASFRLQDHLIEILVPVEERQHCQFLLVNLVVVYVDVSASPFLDLHVVQEQRLKDRLLELRDTEICHCADVLDERFFVVAEYIYVK